MPYSFSTQLSAFLLVNRAFCTILAAYIAPVRRSQQRRTCADAPVPSGSPTST